MQVFVCVFCNESGLKALSIYLKFRKCVFFKLSSCNFNFTLETTPKLHFCFHPLSCLKKVIWPQLCFCNIIYMLQLYLPSESCRGSAETIIHFSKNSDKSSGFTLSNLDSSETSQSGFFCLIDKHYWGKLTSDPLSYSYICTNCMLALTVQKMSGELEILYSNGNARNKKKIYSNNTRVHYMLPRQHFCSVNNKTSVNDPLN